MKQPLTMSTVDIDVIPPEQGDTNAQAVQKLRKDLNPQDIHVRVLELVDPNGNVSVRLSSYSPHKLRRWLDHHGYEDTQVVDHKPNRVPRNRKEKNESMSRLSGTSER